jgi:hypothetical protein
MYNKIHGKIIWVCSIISSAKMGFCEMNITANEEYRIAKNTFGK